MKVVQCKNGHYYDAEKYDECPMCKKNQEAQEKKGIKTEKKIEEQKQTSNFGIQQNEVDLSQLEECKNATTITAVDEVSEPSTMRPNENINQKIDDHKIHHLRPNDGETQVNFGNITQNLGTEDSKNEPIRPDDNGETQIEFGSFVQSQTSASKETADTRNTIHQKPERPDDNGETQVGFGSFKIDSVVQAPPANSGTRKNNGPVVGWLVAVKGPHIGQSFELFPKKNFIGRNDSLVVNLYNDKTVSRTAPLSVIFNRHNNKFMAMAGNSDQTAYINDDLLLQPIELKENDKIDIGNTRLLFIPLLKNGESVESIYKVD